MSDKTDRRVGKTRDAIFTAFAELMLEKRYSNITVQEIIDRANVGRTTFYTHFPTKDDLLNACIEMILDSFDEKNMEHSQMQNNSKNMVPVAEMFEHIKQNSKMVKGMHSFETRELFFAGFKRYWKNKLEAHFSQVTTSTVPVEIIVNFVMTALFELINWWIENGMSYSPEEMEDYFMKLILPSIAAVTKEGEKKI